MFHQRLMQRPVVPVSYLTPLSTCTMSDIREMIGVTPVCIAMEPESTTIVDIIRDIDFGTKKRHRNHGIRK